MKLKDVATITKNSRTQQISFCLKARQLKKKGITPEQLLNYKMSSKELKFLKVVKEKKN